MMSIQGIIAIVIAMLVFASEPTGNFISDLLIAIAVLIVVQLGLLVVRAYIEVKYIYPTDMQGQIHCESYKPENVLEQGRSND